MARKAKSEKQKKPRKAKSSSRLIWKGSIDFGLVNIPVGLYSAEAAGRNPVHFGHGSHSVARLAQAAADFP